MTVEGDGLGLDLAARGTSSSESEAGDLSFGFLGCWGFDFDNRWPNGASSSELSAELGGVFRFAAPYQIRTFRQREKTFDPFATGRAA